MGFAQITALALLAAGCLDAAGAAPDGAAPDLAAADGATADLAAPAGDGAAPDLATAGTLYVYVSGYAPQIARFVLDPASGALTHLGDVASGGSAPAHLSVDAAGKWVLVANYGDGAVAVLPIGAGGALGAAADTRSAGAHAHQILADATSTWVFVPCLGADWVAQYSLAAGGTLTPNVVATAPAASGAGPRHLAFHPSAPYVYLIDETDSTMTVWSYDGAAGRISKIQTLSTRASGATGTNTGAEIVVHPTGRWVYGSNRGDDDLVQFSVASGQLTAVAWTKTGQTPRSFTIDPSGRWLLAAGQGSNDVRVFSVDGTTGNLTAVGTPGTAPSPSFVGVVTLP